MPLVLASDNAINAVLLVPVESGEELFGDMPLRDMESRLLSANYCQGMNNEASASYKASYTPFQILNSHTLGKEPQ